MPKPVNPRHGSMQYWPRKRASRPYNRVRSWPSFNDAKPLGFAGYKVGMSHVSFIDNNKTSLTKGMDIVCPVTVIECPPIKPLSLRFYQQTVSGKKIISEVFAANLDKHLKRKISGSPKSKEEPKEFDDIRLVVYTQPSLTSIKKTPEIFEIAIGGKKEEQLKQGKELLTKDIKVEDVIQPGQFVDIHAVTKGKGFQGAVKRFGIGLTSHRSEKSRRTPGSLGPWKGQTHILYRVAHAGQLGYQSRTVYNNFVVSLSDKPDSINPKSGFSRYGIVKNSYILVRGSVPGPAKRLIRFSIPRRVRKSEEAPALAYIRK